MTGLVQETELKFELTPEAAAALVDSNLLPGEPHLARLRSTYFDTPSRALSAAGFSLRLRRSGDVCIQTLKGGGSATAGLFVRSEWERPVGGDMPVLDEALIGSLHGINLDDLGPAFSVHVERQTWIVVPDDGGEIEFVLDRGEVVAGDRHTPVCEIELELRTGPVPALFALARKIDAAAPLRLGVLSKAERGYRLLGPALRATKAENSVLSSDLTAASAFGRIVASCVRQFRLNEPLIASSQGEALHQARIALRRLRSALTIHKPLLKSDETFSHIADGLRWLAGSLAEARDLDVLAARGDAGAVRAKLEQARLDAYRQATDALDSPRARALIIDLSEWLSTGGWLTDPDTATLRDQKVSDFAAAALEKFRKKVKKGGRGLADLDDTALHEVRKDAKKLRYAAEFFASLFKKRRRKRFIGALETLQDDLGALNDLATAPQMLARLGIDAASDAEHERPALIATALKAHRAFLKADPFWR